MPDTSTLLVDRLNRWLDEHGIDTATVVVRDPDSDLCVTAVRGERLWLVGALESQKHELLSDWATKPSS